MVATNTRGRASGVTTAAARAMAARREREERGPVGRAALPAVGVLFWAIKIVATTLGEAVSDFVADEPLELGYAVAATIFAVALAVSLALQLRGGRYRPAVFWSVILTTSVIGTSISDLLNRTFGLGYTGGMLLLTAALVAVLVVWYASGESMHVDRITTTRAETFYWLATIASNTLGTSSGDFMADELELGFRITFVLLAVAMLVILGLHLWTRLPGALLFWSAYVLARPLGTVLDNSIAQPAEVGGLGVGSVLTSLGLSALLIGLINYQSKHLPDVAGSPPRATSDTLDPGPGGGTIWTTIWTTRVRRPAAFPPLMRTFWATTVVASVLAATTSDLLCEVLALGYATGTVVFLLATGLVLMARQAGLVRGTGGYWAVVLPAGMAGTALADLITRPLPDGVHDIDAGPLGVPLWGLGIGYLAGALVLLGCLMLVFVGWRAKEEPSGATAIVPNRGEGPFWSAVLLAGALGTALGDLVADGTGLGYLNEALAFIGVLFVLGYLVDRPWLPRPAVFWAAFVVTRPLGAAVGDLLIRPVALPDVPEVVATVVILAVLFALLVPGSPRRTRAAQGALRGVRLG